MILWFNVQICL